MAFNISYIIEAIDRFSAVSDKVSESAKKLDANVASAGKKLADMQKQVIDSGENWKKVADKTKYFSLAAAGAIGLSIREWGKQEDAIQRVGIALDNTKGRLGFTIQDLTAQSEALAKSSIFADEDILENVSGKLLLFKGISKDSFGRAQQDIIDYATYMKVDLATASAVVGRALNSPSKGIRGLRSAGIQLTAAQMQTITALEKTGQTAKAQEIIFKALESRFKGVGEAATLTSSGQIKMAEKQIGELAETMGKNLIPVILPVIKALSWFVEALANSHPVVKGTIAGILLFVAVISPLAFIISQLIVVFGYLTIAANVLQIAFWRLAAALAAGAAPIYIWIGVVALLAFAFYKVWENWNMVSSAIGDGIQWLVGMFQKLIEMIQSAGQWLAGIGGEISGGMELVKSVSNIFSSTSEVGGRIDVNINDKAGKVESATSKSNSGVELPVGQNMPAGA